MSLFVYFFYRRFMIDFLMFSFIFLPFHNQNVSDKYEECSIYLTTAQVLNEVSVCARPKGRRFWNQLGALRA